MKYQREEVKNMDKIQQIFGSIIFIALLVIGIYFVFRWSDLRNIELRIRAINECIKDSYSVQPGVFNGAVYKICIEDKGYSTNVK